MNEITEYKIFYLDSTRAEKQMNKFIAAMNKAISEGWIPQGGVCYSTDHVLYQALVKIKKT